MFLHEGWKCLNARWRGVRLWQMWCPGLSKVLTAKQIFKLFRVGRVDVPKEMADVENLRRCGLDVYGVLKWFVEAVDVEVFAKVVVGRLSGESLSYGRGEVQRVEKEWVGLESFDLLNVVHSVAWLSHVSKPDVQTYASLSSWSKVVWEMPEYGWDFS